MGLNPWQHKKIEDADLLKLIGAVLGSTQQVKPKRGFRQRLHRWKATLRKQTRKHPFASIGVVVVFILVAFFLGAVSTNIIRGTKASANVIRDGASRDGAAVSGTAGGTSGGTLVAEEKKPKPKDVAAELLERVVSGTYSRRSDIATGRFLRDFEEQWLLLVDVDRTRFELARRGPGWVQVRAPYRASESRWKHRTHLTIRKEHWRRATEAMIRMVEENNIWKLEHIRVY